MARRRRRSYSRSTGQRQGTRLVSRPLIVVGIVLFLVGVFGTVLPLASFPIPQTVGIWSLICSNLLLIVGAFSREM